jgi:hypothetical protein
MPSFCVVLKEIGIIRVEIITEKRNIVGLLQRWFTSNVKE